jgi:hypothetical protein
MRDPDTLRQALWETEYQAKAGDDLDIAAIMKRGRRMRLRRRLAAAGGSMCVAAAVYGVVVGTTHLTQPSPGPVRPAGPARFVPAVPSPSRTDLKATPVPVSSPVGTAGQPTPSASATKNVTGTSPQPTSVPHSPTSSP